MAWDQGAMRQASDGVWPKAKPSMAWYFSVWSVLIMAAREGRRSENGLWTLDFGP